MKTTRIFWLLLTGCLCTKIFMATQPVLVPGLQQRNQNPGAAQGGVTVEFVAEEIARRHNANAKALLDDMTVSTSATAKGKNVIFSYVLRVKKGLSPEKLAEFKAETMKVIVPRVCQANASNEAFKRGLFYTFIYHNTYGEKLLEFVVDKEICDRK